MTIAEITKRINDYVAQLDSNIEQAVIPVKDDIIKINYSQLDNSTGTDDKALVHALTGSPNLSPAYAKRMRKSKPDIFVTGDFRKEMFLEIYDGAKQYMISSYHRLVKYLPSHYKNMFGIAPSNKDKAYSITTPAIGRHFKRVVFGQ